MIKALAIDDEEGVLNVLENSVKNYLPEISFFQTAKGALAGLEKISAIKPDLVFLDVEMPVMNGFELLERIGEKNFEVIFVTAFGHYAIKAIRYSAIDYLLKPIDADDLRAAFERFKEKRKNKDELQKQFDSLQHNLLAKKSEDFRLTIHTTEGMHIFKTDEILSCTADGNYTRFALVNKKKFIASRTLKDFEELLKEHDFIRVHRAHLVNKKFIKSFSSNNELVLTDNSRVEVSLRKISEVKRLLNSY